MNFEKDIYYTFYVDFIENIRIFEGDYRNNNFEFDEEPLYIIGFDDYVLKKDFFERLGWEPIEDILEEYGKEVYALCNEFAVFINSEVVYNDAI